MVQWLILSKVLTEILSPLKEHFVAGFWSKDSHIEQLERQYLSNAFCICNTLFFMYL